MAALLPPSCCLAFYPDATNEPLAYGALALACKARQQHGNSVEIELLRATDPAHSPSVVLTTSNGIRFCGPKAVMRYLCRIYLPALYEVLLGSRVAELATAVDSFLDFSVASSFDALRHELVTLNTFLKLRSYMVAHSLTVADIFIWGELKGNSVFQRMLKSPKTKSDYPHLLRWYALVDSLASANEAVAMVIEFRHACNKEKKDQGSLDIELPGLKPGVPVVTRFPPEPSGYMHIGHAKAVLLNEFYARKYPGGKLIFRFDDTNPTKENAEFEDAIAADVARLGVKPDICSRTSDHFAVILDYMTKMIENNDAYVDDTDKETMRRQRMVGEASASRDLPVAESLRRWQEMRDATPFGLTCCVRARISVDDNNKAMRDPVMYRCNLTPHHHTGATYKVYPTYDFACPIVDAIEGVTHALRTSEYRDREAQYMWIQARLGLRKVHVIEFSRLNFVYTLLSKRKLAYFVESGLVRGWDDPRFPTVRGILRRGLTVEALRAYVLMQGASLKDLLLEWDKLWAINRKLIDPNAPRHVAISESSHVQLHLTIDNPQEREPALRAVPRHKKNSALGNKMTAYSDSLLIERADARDLAVDEEFTLMDWGNAVVTKITRDTTSGAIEAVEARLHLAGDVKSTRLKLTWLASQHTRRVELRTYDYLITKKKLDEGDDVKDFLTPCSEFSTWALADKDTESVKHGHIIQFERRGFFICDVPYDALDASRVPVFISVPDSKAASVASKHVSNATSASASGSSTSTLSPSSSSSLLSGSASTHEKRRERRNSDPQKAGMNAHGASKPNTGAAAAQAAAQAAHAASAASAAASAGANTQTQPASAGTKIRRRVSFSDDAIAHINAELREKSQQPFVPISGLETRMGLIDAGDSDISPTYSSESLASPIAKRGKMRSPPPRPSN